MLKRCDYCGVDTSGPESHSLEDCRDRLRSLFVAAYTALESADEIEDHNSFNRAWIGALEMGIDNLTDHQVEWMVKQDREPYPTVLRIDREWKEQQKALTAQEGGRMSETQRSNPFVTLEAAVEHLQSARISLTAPQSATSPAYHLEAAEEACRRLFQTLVLLLPGAYASYEGEPTDTIIGQIDQAS